MGRRNNNITTLRKLLLSEEKSLLEELDVESKMVEKRVLIGLKRTAIMLAGLLAGITIYRLLIPRQAQTRKDKP